jgi:hypothetical protein
MLASKLKGNGSTPLSDRDDILRASYRKSGGSQTPLVMKFEKKPGSKVTMTHLPTYDGTSISVADSEVESAIINEGSSHITDDLLHL